MSTKKRIFLVTAAIISLSMLAFITQAQSPSDAPGKMMDTSGAGCCCDMGPGMGPGMGMMGGMGCNMGMMGGLRSVWALDLNDDQKTKVRKIHDALRKEHWELKGKMMDIQSDLQELQAAETLDAKKIGAALDRMHELQKKMVVSGIEAHNKVMGLLSAEQRKELKAAGPGGMNCANCPKRRHRMMQQ